MQRVFLNFGKLQPGCGARVPARDAQQRFCPTAVQLLVSAAVGALTNTDFSSVSPLC